MPEENGKSPVPGQPVTHERPLPEHIGPYKVVAEIGRGGMGTVYRAHEASLNRDVAIKVLARHLADDDTVVTRFSREARSTAALSHPNVVHIYSTGIEQGLPYFAMEYVRGETLADLIRREKRLQPRRAAEILLQAASGLAAAHDHGIVHRDVKPGNLMLDRSGHLKVTDFGIALAWDAGDKLTTTGQFVGTSGYISPEGCKGEPVDARSDIFSLGVVLYELLAGETPFNDDSPLGMLVQVVEAKVPDVRRLNPDVDDGLLGILDRMIEKNPDDRYQTCHELVRDLSDYLIRQQHVTIASGPGTSVATARMDQLPVSTPRRRWPVVLAAVVVMGLVGSAAGYYVWSEYQAEPDPRAIRATVDGSDAGSPDATAVAVPEAATGPDDSAVGEIAQQVPSGKTGDSNDNGLPRAAISGPDEPTSPGDRAREPDSNAGDTGSSVAGGPETATGPDGVEAADAAESDPMAPIETDRSEAGTAATGERVASISPARATPVTAGPPRVLVVADGDPVIAGPIEEMIREAVDPARFRLMEKAFLPGLDRHVGAGGLDVPGLGDLVADQGGRILIIARIVPVGSTPLYYYGRTSTLYTSRIELESYDLIERRRIGDGWSNEVRYTELNAAQQAEDAVMPLADRLAEALRGERFGDG